MTDVIFAVDSVPAIFALTREPFIVFTSNIFAILGLRSMYFLLAGAVERFHLLKYGLAAVLVFVGLKMVWLNEAFGGKFPIGWSLALIALALGSSIAASLWWPGDPRPTGARSPSGRGRDEHEVQLLGPVHPARERELDVGRPAGPRDESEVGRIADSGAAVTIKPVWTGDFNDAAKAQQFATQLIGSGADVIVGSLNQGATGTFQAFEGKPSGSGWVTAKYTDKSAAAGPHYAGSLQYDFAKPLGDVLAKIAAGTRTGRYPLGFDTGVTISMSANVPADVKTAVTEVMDKIKSGQITVKLDTSKIG